MRFKKSLTKQKPYLAVTANLMLTTSQTHTISVRINTKDPHRTDKKTQTKKKGKQIKKKSDSHVTKKEKKLFYDKVEGIDMDLLHCDSFMTSFNFKVLDTMGYLEEICLKKESSVCSSAWCRRECHHLVWIFHNLFKFDKEQPIMYPSKFTDQQ